MPQSLLLPTPGKQSLKIKIVYGRPVPSQVHKKSWHPLDPGPVQGTLGMWWPVSSISREESPNCWCRRKRKGTREITCVSSSLLRWASDLVPLHLAIQMGTEGPVLLSFWQTLVKSLLIALFSLGFHWEKSTLFLRFLNSYQPRLQPCFSLS